MTALARPCVPCYCLPISAMAGGGLQPILKLGVPVRGLPPPPNDASVRPVRGGSLFPEISLSLHTKLQGVTRT